MLRRWLNRFLGAGPHRIASFDAVVASRIRNARGVHQPEYFDGLLVAKSDEGSVYHLGHPLLGQVDASEMIGARRRYLASGIAPAPAGRLFSLSDAGVVGDDGLVYCPRSRTAVAETIRRWTTAPITHPALAAPGLPAPQPLPGVTLNLGALSAEGYFHFLFESLPRLWLARPWLPHLKQVLVPGSPDSFQGQWLKRAGISADKIVWLRGLAHHRCEQLLFTNYLMHDQQPSALIVQALRELLDAAPPAHPGRRRLWLSRADARTRQPAWEASLLAKLPGFECVTLAGRTPAEQIALMREAAVVAGPHGAGFANLAFCAPGTRVVEIAPQPARSQLYSRLANICQLPYAWAVTDFDREAPAELADSILKFSA